MMTFMLACISIIFFLFKSATFLDGEIEIMSEEAAYEFKYCSSATSLREAHRLRLEVFHQEQGFPEDTEVDE